MVPAGSSGPSGPVGPFGVSSRSSELASSAAVACLEVERRDELSRWATRLAAPARLAFAAGGTPPAERRAPGRLRKTCKLLEGAGLDDGDVALKGRSAGV